MKKRIISIISVIALVITMVAFMPVKETNAAPNNIVVTRCSIADNTVDAGSGIAQITVNVGVRVLDHPTVEVSSISVILESIDGGVNSRLAGTKTTGFNGSDTYSVKVDVPVGAIGRYSVMSVSAYATDGSGDVRGNMDGYDFVYVSNSSIDSFPPYVRSVDTEWVKIGKGRYVRLLVSAYDNSGYGQISMVLASFKNENGDKIEMSARQRNGSGYYYALLYEDEIKNDGTYELVQLIVRDNSGNEVLYYFPTQEVTINGNTRRTFPTSLDGTSFTVGDTQSSTQATTAAPQTEAAASSEPKSPTTTQGNAGMVMLVLAALAFVSVSVIVYATKKISAR